MDLTLVPFGYLVSKNQLVDAQQVPSGKRCGCICPSCKAPLVARKGTKKVWYFAHDSKGELQNKLKKCSFSFYVSARMMARQMIGNRLSVNLPRLEVALSEKEPFSDEQIHVDKLVTGEHQAMFLKFPQKASLLSYQHGYHEYPFASMIDVHIHE